MGTAIKTPRPVIAMLIKKQTASSSNTTVTDRPTPMNGARAIRMTA